MVAELLPGLKQADLRFREINKTIILALLDNYTRPIKTQNEKMIEATSDIILRLISIFSANIAPNFSQHVQTEHEKMRAQPEETRQTELKNAAEILNILTHRERIEYYLDFLVNGPVANNKWWVKLNKQQRVRYRIADINTPDNT